MDTVLERIRRSDPRYFQIAALSLLLLWGLTALDLEVRPGNAALIVGSALATQLFFTRRLALAAFDPKSALISSLSLCLLLRTSSVALAVLAAVIAIASKFLIRRRGKHVFNPTAFALVVLLLATPSAVWVSAGQWGSTALAAFAVAGLGNLVIRRTTRADITWAFLAALGAALFGRALWLGDPLTIPWHQMSRGSLLIFAFFMISDPRTAPDSRPGRILFASLVAASAVFVEQALYHPNGALYALVFGAPLVPLIDRLLPGQRHRWPGAAAGSSMRRQFSRLLPQEGPMRAFSKLTPLLVCLALAISLLAASPAFAFCGFYVARADTNLYNEASQVVLVRDGDRTVLTMANDYQGDPREFAMVIPVPTLLERGQIHVAEMALIDHLDAFTAPRLVEYFDDDPCARDQRRRLFAQSELREEGARMDAPAAKRAKALGVTIEAEYTVGEYDILILSAKESRGLVTWLKESGYRLPPGAEPVVGSYLRQKQHFFVAKVNLEEQSRLGVEKLRPLQVAFESPRFMLPIRLGTVNARGKQELFVYALTRNGRVETTNYRTVKLPTGNEIPPFVKSDFGRFYRDMFRQQTLAENERAVFLEYAWDMSWCDPCASPPLSPQELRQLGVFWLDEGGGTFVTRLHLRYDREHFPEDLRFQVTGDTSTYQGRYVLRHPWRGTTTCQAADNYRRELGRRQRVEAETLASLTGWRLDQILTKSDIEALPATQETPWWRKLWGR
ncbi:MAG: DUF2330 domain-containing protein [Acidobacteriota bacterium]